MPASEATRAGGPTLTAIGKLTIAALSVGPQEQARLRSRECQPFVETSTREGTCRCRLLMTWRVHCSS